VLLIEVLLRLSSAKLVALTNCDNGGGVKTTALAGTVTVTAGSLTVTGAGTAFVTSGLQGLVNTYGGVLVQFASQPGVNYVVTAVASDTSLTLAKAYGGVTASGVAASLPNVNYTTLQQAVFDAQAEYQDVTDLVYDDVTVSTTNAGANPTLNRSVWAGVALVVAYLYDPGRGNPWPEAEVDAAWRLARKRLDFILHNRGDGAYSNPVTDSVFNPSIGPTRLPNMDNQRFGDLSPSDPGPGPSGTPGGGWGGGGGGGFDSSWGW
jgi:hypothetical protein